METPCGGCGACDATDPENDCPCSRECDETLCDVHAQEEMKRWGDYFGIRPGMSRVQRLLQLEAFRPATLPFPEDA